jgi:hypothetical protein
MSVYWNICDRHILNHQIQVDYEQELCDIVKNQTSTIYY